ncbi:hypothetical protein TMEN_6778 [Trichophyton mentagrophytes]|nr:hypothetical protein TMEN_6778 [Trichophyton mentagrophytes]
MESHRQRRAAATTVARATSAVPMLFPSVTIPGAGTYQDGGTRLRNNNPLYLGLSEVRRLWPSTPLPDAVVSLGICSASVTDSPKIGTSFRNILIDGWIPRAYRTFNSSYDGEESWREIWELLDDEARSRYIRLNVPFPTGARQSIDNPNQMDGLSKWVQKQPLQFLQIPRAISLLLKSSFFFELDSLPRFQYGLFLCTGSVQCRTPPKQTIEALQSLYPERITFYKNDIDLGVYLSNKDIYGFNLDFSPTTFNALCEDIFQTDVVKPQEPKGVTALQNGSTTMIIITPEQYKLAEIEEKVASMQR